MCIKQNRQTDTQNTIYAKSAEYKTICLNLHVL